MNDAFMCEAVFYAVSTSLTSSNSLTIIFPFQKWQTW